MIFDLEGDGLKPTKIHVLSWEDEGGNVKSTFDYDKMREILVNAKLLIGHNIIGFDIPVLEKILNIKITARLIDTLAVSWYIYPKRLVHGLESYGLEFGVPKPEIDDWWGLSPEEYRHRCEEDVKINSKLWKKQWSKLLLLYPNAEEANRMVNYLSFKMKCAALQQKSRWKLDFDRCKKGYDEIVPLIEEKTKALISVMPKVPVYKEYTHPKKPYKKDGSLSKIGEAWYAMLKQEGLPKGHTQPVKVLVNMQEPKPTSPAQVKDWLFSLGWEPEAFKYSKDQEGNEKAVPQVRIDAEGGKKLCPSVTRLAEENESVSILEGLSVLQHRASILKGFLEEEEDGYLVARIAGLTNTLRFKHKVLVNLPGVDKDYGELIRGCLVAPEGYELCGSDMVSLEDTTKKHYMYPYDPEYVEEMSKPDFDSHLDLAKFAGATNEEEVAKHLDKNDPFDLTAVRKQYKAANYSCIYGIGKATLSRDLKCTTAFASSLIESYWERNAAVKKVVEALKVKTIHGEMWLFNPVSRLYYSLRSEKDKFSTLNQGTGVYCFDMWVKEFLSLREQLTGQFHDEVILCIKKGHRDQCTKLLKNAIGKVNDKLKLNVPLDVSIDFGDSYADIH